MSVIEPPIERAKVLATVQNVFFGRFYSTDIFLFYRALSGQYYRSPVMAGAMLFTQVYGDVLQFIGPLPPTDRAVAFLDEISIFWNNQIKRVLSPLFPVEELWEGWDVFTRMLEQDLKERPPPTPLPPQATHIESVKLTDEQVEKLPFSKKVAYYSYRGDVDWSEQVYKYASAYFPEFFTVISAVWPDHLKIFEYYGNWAKECFLKVPAKNEDRIMGKVILLSNYRFNMIVPDLLFPLHETFQKEGFRKGLLEIASHVRKEAEEIRVTPVPLKL